MSKDLINKILEEVGLESIYSEAEDSKPEGLCLDARPDSKTRLQTGQSVQV